MPHRLTAVAILMGYHSTPVLGGCGGGDWYDVYAGERCYNTDDGFGISCNEKWNGDTCGARLQHNNNIGVGSLSLGIKAAPGNGVITSFYLSNNGGMYDEGGSWNEIDFEIMGMQASGGGSRIWTNFFTGSAVEHHGFQSVPFDVTADEHIFSFDINNTHITWLVDGEPLRTSDITAYDDMKGAIASSSFVGFLSIWGKANANPMVGCQEFVDGMGKLDDNPNNFPLQATFRPVGEIPTTSPKPTTRKPAAVPGAPAAVPGAAAAAAVPVAAANPPQAKFEIHTGGVLSPPASASVMFAAVALVAALLLSGVVVRLRKDRCLPEQDLVVEELLGSESACSVE